MIATIVISGVLLAIVAFIVRSLVRKARQGQLLGCDCGCSECPIASSCHTSGSPLIQIQLPDRPQAH